jgi:hypothetical protein
LTHTSPPLGAADGTSPIISQDTPIESICAVIRPDLPMMVRRANAHYLVEVDANDDRQRIARDLWTHIRSLNTQNVRQYPAAARAIDGGADPSDVVRAMAAAS